MSQISSPISFHTYLVDGVLRVVISDSRLPHLGQGWQQLGSRQPRLIHLLGIRGQRVQHLHRPAVSYLKYLLSQDQNRGKSLAVIVAAGMFDLIDLVGHRHRAEYPSAREENQHSVVMQKLKDLKTDIQNLGVPASVAIFSVALFGKTPYCKDSWNSIRLLNSLIIKENQDVLLSCSPNFWKNLDYEIYNLHKGKQIRSSLQQSKHWASLMTKTLRKIVKLKFTKTDIVKCVPGSSTVGKFCFLFIYFFYTKLSM